MDVRIIIPEFSAHRGWRLDNRNIRLPACAMLMGVLLINGRKSGCSKKPPVVRSEKYQQSRVNLRATAGWKHKAWARWPVCPAGLRQLDRRTVFSCQICQRNRFYPRCWKNSEKNSGVGSGDSYRQLVQTSLQIHLRILHTKYYSRTFYNNIAGGSLAQLQVHIKENGAVWAGPSWKNLSWYFLSAMHPGTTPDVGPTNML